MYGYVLAFLSGTCTGLTVAVGKVAAHHLSASMYVFLISFCSLVMMYIWRSCTMTWKIRLPEKSVRAPLFLQSAFSAFALWGFWEGARQINTGVASFAVRTELVFVLVASWIFFKERIDKIGILGALLIMLGSIAMGMTPSDDAITDLHRSSHYTYGISIVILSGAGFAASECFAKIIANRIEPSELVIWRGIFLGLVFFLLVLVEDGSAAFSSVTLSDWGVCTLAALLGPVLARLLFMFSLRRIDLGKAYLICQNEPIVTAVFAWLLIGEKMSPSHMTGALFILIGCVVISLPGLAKARQTV